MILDILINGERVDILNRNSINLRINNVVYNPTEINSRQAEYSFSFNLPTTPTNNRIFNYANVLAKTDKFQNVYDCEVYSDETLIFKGSLRIQSIKKGFYNVNLVNIKINTVDDIFGEMKLNDLNWLIPFTGLESINTHNENPQSKVIFPLVSYGVFLKEPSSKTADYNNYTSKFVIDKYNKWYYESFNPSPNLLELVKRLFKSKGYDVQGNIFQDEAMTNIYTSMNIANDLYPTYNLGQPNLGKAKIITEFNNKVNKNTGASSVAESLVNELSFPYLTVQNEASIASVNSYDLWSSKNSKITRINQQYLFDEFSNCIVIPADGLYKVRIKADIDLPVLEGLIGLEWFQPADRYGEPQQGEAPIENNLSRGMPVEIQLVKNEDQCELIHGPYQWWKNPKDGVISSWDTAYPHERLYSALNPSLKTPAYSNSNYRPSREYPEKGYDGGGREFGGSGRPFRPTPGVNDGSLMGYMPNQGQFLAFDPWVNPNFIAGFSSMSSGTPSFIKNGYSWNRSNPDRFDSRYNCPGYFKVTRTGRRPNITYKREQTDFNKNVLLDAPINTSTYSDRQVSGEVSGIVYLRRNDVLMLKALTRYWENSAGSIIKYEFNAKVEVEIEAYSPHSIETIDQLKKTWNDPSLFDKDLQIGNFLNKEVKVSDFINNFLKQFNLLYVNIGNTIRLDTLNLDINKPKYAINLDNRVNEGESRLIEYPSYMLVKYKIDTDEWGFETTVPKEHINDHNWKDYGDYGSDKIIINDRNDERGEEISVNTSYTYYDTFTILNNDGSEQGKINIPVISKYSYMIDGYNYEDSMKHDGKGLPMRYWFRGKNTGFFVNVNGKYPVYIYSTYNTYKGLDLSYKEEGNTLLTKYFNISPYLGGNYVSISCYLSAKEYELLKNGANVIFDSDVYIVSEIQGYDAMGINQTELLLIKKK